MKNKMKIAVLLIGMCLLVLGNIIYISFIHNKELASNKKEVILLKKENCELKLVVDTLSQVYVDNKICTPEIYKKKDEFLQHTCEKTIGDDSLELYNSVKHGLSIINLIRGTFDYYKKLRRTNPDHIPIGLCNLPMDVKYIKMLAYEIYEFPTYVPDKKHKYFF